MVENRADLARATAHAAGDPGVDQGRGPRLPWVLLGLSATLIRAPHRRLGASIEEALQALGEGLQADEVRLVHKEPSGALKGHVWTRRRARLVEKGDEQPPWIARRLSLEHAVAHLRSGSSRRNDRLPDLPPRVGAAIFAPVRIGKQPAGLLAVTARTPRSWKEEAIELTRQLAEMMGAAFEREASLKAMTGEQEARRDAESETRRLRDQLAHVGRVTVLGEMAATLAHDLKQPLTAIYSNAQAAQRLLDNKPPGVTEARQALHDLEEDCRWAAEVLGRLQQMFRRRESERAPLSIGPLVEHVQRLLHEDAVARGVQVSVDVPPDLPQIHGDRVQLEQVVMNLLVNAFDAVTAHDASAARLVAIRARARGHAIELAVRDTGPGIVPGECERIFEPFFTRKSNGMGMGLCICRTIVSAHGGQIVARTPAGGGSIFEITLPVSSHSEGAAP